MENAFFLKQFLTHFGAVSGLNINYANSSIQFSSNVSEAIIDPILNELNVRQTTVLEKYLGIPVTKGRITKEVLMT